MEEESLSTRDTLLDAMEELSKEAKELYLDRRVPEMNCVPDSLSFYREYVSANKPLVIRQSLGWHAVSKWSTHYLRSVAGQSSVCVAVTPNGYADAVNDGHFVMPEERSMTLDKFLDIMENPGSTNGVFYIQKQNSNFTEEFTTLIKDAACDIPWATEAFVHKDHYENLYCVVSGWKKFILIPPTDQPFVPYEDYIPAHYEETGGGNFTIKVDNQSEKVPWIPVDPLDPDLVKYPQFSGVTCYEVTVHAGDMLYLPSLWFHHVRQSHGCVAVNFWYDMEFDIKYNYFKFVEKLTSLVRKGKKPSKTEDVT